MFRVFVLLLLAALPIASQAQQAPAPPVRMAIAGLSHGHVGWLLGRADRGDVEVVGIFETDQQLIDRLAEQYGFSKDLVYGDLGRMLDQTRPETVVAFGSIFDHLMVVEAAAPRGIHVMVEKPLAVSLDHAQKMEALAHTHGIHLLTNYETTWYPSTHETYDLVNQQGVAGPIRKIVVHDGHQGPQEIGVGPEFLVWLTDPVLNGAGALMDFGCYGANLVTWLMQGVEPTTVTAVTQQLKPHIYPKVDDEATIILTYPEAQAVIQASWNWPYNRKDMQVYGMDGYIFAMDGRSMRIRVGNDPEQSMMLEPAVPPLDDPFAFLAAVVRGDLTVHPGDLSSLENNMTVMRILDAAKRSAQSGQTVQLAP